LPAPQPIDLLKWIAIPAGAALLLLLVLWIFGGKPSADRLVDPAVVGEWVISGTNQMGAWTLDFNLQSSGHYVTTSSGPGAISNETGVFEAKNGAYTVHSDTGRMDRG